MELHRSQADECEICIRDVLSRIKPSEADRIMRVTMIDQLAYLFQTVDCLKGAVVKPFGSYLSNLYSKWGDLDISVEVSHDLRVATSRNRKQSFLREIMRVLRRRGVAFSFQLVPQARVPILKFEGSYQKISCDISIDNHMGQIKSKILLLITALDERFRDMVLLTKEWAKAQNINDPKSGTLNSFSLCLLLIFHFQTCDPAILPPLKEIYPGNIRDDITGTTLITETDIEDVCAENIRKFRLQNLRSRNQSSMYELLISFFRKFSAIEARAAEYAVCTHTARLERRSSQSTWMGKSHSLLVEDPFERPENAARAVGMRELCLISDAFKHAFAEISSSRAKNYIRDNFVRPMSSTTQRQARIENHHTANGAIGNGPKQSDIGYNMYSHKPDPTWFHNGGQGTRTGTLPPPERFQSLKVDMDHPPSSNFSRRPNETRMHNGRPATHIGTLPRQGTHTETLPLAERFQSLKVDTEHPPSSNFSRRPNETRTHNGRQATYKLGTMPFPGIHTAMPLAERFQSLRQDMDLPASSSTSNIQRQGAQTVQSQRMWRPRYADNL